MRARKHEGLQVPPGFIERGESTMVVQAYLGGLAVSVVAGGKVKKNFINGARFMDRQKSDYSSNEICESSWAKGIADQQLP